MYVTYYYSQVWTVVGYQHEYIICITDFSIVLPRGRTVTESSWLVPGTVDPMDD